MALHLLGVSGEITIADFGRVAAITIPLLFSCYAMIVSRRTLAIALDNQVERRHGEMMQEREKIDVSVSAMRQRMKSLFFATQIVKIEFNRTPDNSPNRSGIVESMVGLEKNLEGLEAVERNITSIVQTCDMVGKHPNKSDSLVTLQSAAFELKRFIPALESQEKMLSDILNSMRVENAMLRILSDESKLSGPAAS